MSVEFDARRTLPTSRPRESGDPYAAAVQIKNAVWHMAVTREHGVWVPARASLGRDDNRSRSHDLKKLFAAFLDARFLVMATCSRSISECISSMRSVGSSTDSSDRPCPLCAQ